ncbi:CD109 antigen-like [Phlebotomus argentipes]|uniref:CD109 antigen-like n=1 Tax=Phlebotomus argentipes TaxID=94469 RepID=UPI0028930EC8|nr:CD109 antigen-like [Phlebotomus argentipes]
MNRWLKCLMLIGSLATSVSSFDGYYTIIAPKHIHPHSVYNVSIATHATEEANNFIVDLQGYPFGKMQNFTASRQVAVAANSTKTVTFRLGALPAGKYKLVVDGSDFRNSTKLQYLPKSLLCFIQTDKRIYKPGTIVRFRVLLLKADLRPSKTLKKVNVAIFDSNNLKIMEWNEADLKHGVFSAELRLSQDISLGWWTIEAKAAKMKSEEVFTQRFEVAEYILPKFKVEIQSEKFSTFTKGSFKFSVKSEYNYGKPMKGNFTATVSLKPYIGFPKIPIATKTGEINGVTEIEFSFEDDLHLKQKFDRIFTVDVTVQDNLTGLCQNTSEELGVFLAKHAISFLTPPDYFKPGLNYNVIVSVKHHDGSPFLGKEENNVTLLYGYDYETAEENSVNLTLTSEGLAYGGFFVPRNVKKLYVKALFEDAHVILPHILRARSKKKRFILANLITKTPTVNSTCIVEVTTTHRLNYLTYHIVARDNLVYTAFVNFTTDGVMRISFPVTPEMVPSATFLVYYVASTGYLIYDRLVINFHLKNTFNLKVSHATATPGQEVIISIDSESPGFVNLVAVDKSVLEMQHEKHMLTEKRVAETLQDFVKYSPLQIVRSLRRVPRKKFFKEFDDAGVILMSNVKKGGKKPGFSQLLTFDEEEELPDEADEDYGEFEGVISQKDVTSGEPGEINARRYFPETWLWWDVVTQSKGKLLIKVKVPDKITGWVLSGFSVDENTGLSLIKQPVSVSVFQAFFISTSLPYSVKRGEIVTIPVVVFNYLNETRPVEVIFRNIQRDFCFEDLSICNASQRIEIMATNQTGTSLEFHLIPQRLGRVKFEVVARSGDLMDKIVRELLVVAEGEVQYDNQAFLVDLHTLSSAAESFTPHLPDNFVPDSLEMKINIMKNILASSMENLDELVPHLPTGCGEQNLITFAPNVAVLDYMTRTRRHNEDLRIRALRFMRQAYQRQLKFRHRDGSFSAFGDADETGSIWLTAYAARTFLWASRYITVDRRVTDKALKWLSQQQLEDGSFIEYGISIRIFDREMFTADTNRVGMTAFSILPFLETGIGWTKYAATLEKAYDYIEKEFPNVEDVYSLSLAAYAAQFFEGNLRERAVEVLNERAQRDRGKIWWESKSDGMNLSIESTSYALLANLAAEHLEECVGATKWLISQRNSRGGFTSTHDTVLGLFALAKVAERLEFSSNSMNFTINQLNIKNFSDMKSIKVNPGLRNVTITASGRGYAIIEFTTKFNVGSAKKFSQIEYFALESKVKFLGSHDNFLNLTFCTHFNPQSRFMRQSNMTVMEIVLPSGHRIDRDQTNLLNGLQTFKKVEFRNGDTKAIIYFCEITEQDVCPTLMAYKTHRVKRAYRGKISIYDYYNPSECFSLVYCFPRNIFNFHLSSRHYQQGVLLILSPSSVKT